jgi:NADP-dependent aldehyde dehydrogenase
MQRLASGEAAGGRAGAGVVVPGDGEAFMAQDSVLQTEVFGPLSVLVEVADESQMMALVSTLQGQLTATLHADADDRPAGGEPAAAAVR